MSVTFQPRPTPYAAPAAAAPQTGASVGTTMNPSATAPMAPVAPGTFAPRTDAGVRGALGARLAEPSGLLMPGLSPTQQWLYWETNMSFDEVRRPFVPVALSITDVPASEVEHLMLPGHLADPELSSCFFDTPGVVAWPRHPDNTAEQVRHGNQMVPVPYAKAPESRRWKAWFTASRSMIVQHPTSGKLLSVKLPTDHPTPQAAEPHKADMVNHTTIAVARGAHVRQVEAAGGGSSSLIVQPDIGAIWEKGSRNGFIVRDVSSFLDEDHYYMPGFALPRYGIAYDKEPKALVERFAEISARAKANLLLGYGLWMKSPHGQNTVLQMTKDMEPTGTAVFRDMSDTSFVPHVARALGFDAEVSSDVSKGYSVVDKMTSDWSITIPGLDHNGFVNYTELTEAKEVHDRAFARAVAESLATCDPKLDEILATCTTFEAVDAALRSEAGQRGLQAFADRRGKAAV